MSVTSKNVKNVRIVSGSLVLYESGAVSTTATKTNLDAAITFLGSTDSDPDVRKECHAALREIKFSGSLGNFGG